MSSGSSFSALLKEALQEASLSQAQFALDLQISGPLVSKWMDEPPTTEGLRLCLSHPAFDDRTRRRLLKAWLSERLGEPCLELLEKQEPPSDRKLLNLFGQLNSQTQDALRSLMTLAATHYTLARHLVTFESLVNPPATETPATRPGLARRRKFQRRGRRGGTGES